MRYPLAALEALREREVEAARGALAAAVAGGEGARRRCAEALDALSEAAARRRAAEGAAVEAAGAAALVQAASWIARLRGEERARAQALAGARAAETEAAGEEERARGVLADAERRLRAVERHRGLWEGARRRAVDAAQEAEAEERWGPRQRRT